MGKHKSQKGTRKADAVADPADSADVAEAASMDELRQEESTAESSGSEGEPSAGPALVELPEGAVHRLQDEVNEQKDRYLRLAAEFDNFKKRTQRERAETWARAQAHVVGSILEVLDDLARVAQLDVAQATSADVLSGVELVERKLLRALETAGLERVGGAGSPFDPNQHEAVTTVAASAPEQDHHVAEVLQVGYRFGGGLLRPARVSVFVWPGGPESDGGGPDGGEAA